MFPHYRSKQSPRHSLDRIADHNSTGGGRHDFVRCRRREILYARPGLRDSCPAGIQKLYIACIASSVLLRISFMALNTTAAIHYRAFVLWLKRCSMYTHPNKLAHMKNAINFVLFYLGWIVCVSGAAYGYFWLGPLTIAGIVTVHLLLSGAAWRRELLLLATIGLLGPISDSLYILTGMLSYAGVEPGRWIAPSWIIALWIGFAMTLNFSLGWLKHRYELAAAFGALGGPLSYWAGVRLGAVDWAASPWLVCVVLALVWTLLMPATAWLARRLCDRDETLALSGSSVVAERSPFAGHSRERDIL